MSSRIIPGWFKMISGHSRIENEYQHTTAINLYKFNTNPQKPHFMKTFLLFILILICTYPRLAAQDKLNGKIKVFLDCTEKHVMKIL